MTVFWGRGLCCKGSTRLPSRGVGRGSRRHRVHQVEGLLQAGGPGAGGGLGWTGGGDGARELVWPLQTPRYLLCGIRLNMCAPVPHEACGGLEAVSAAVFSGPQRDLWAHRGAEDVQFPPAAPGNAPCVGRRLEHFRRSSHFSVRALDRARRSDPEPRFLPTAPGSEQTLSPVCVTWARRLLPASLGFVRSGGSHAGLLAAHRGVG